MINLTVKKPTILLMGPTASGKTDLALALANELPCYLISVDSALIHRGMDIGTAKPSGDVLRQHPHALIDILNPNETYSAAAFVKDAQVHIQKAHAENRLPILVGGTMMYFQFFMRGITTLPETNISIRHELIDQGLTKGWACLHEQLIAVDPQSAGRIHSNDSQRIVRALEVYLNTGRTLSQWWHEQTLAPQVQENISIGLIPSDRNNLHARIEQRFKDMVQQGLVDEAQQLLNQWGGDTKLPLWKSVGYKQVFEHLHGSYDLKEMTMRGIFATRQLAKRQYTWLRKWQPQQVFDPDTGQNTAFWVKKIKMQMINL